MACTGNFYIFCVSFDICKFLVGLAGLVYGNDSVCVTVEKSPIYVFYLVVESFYIHSAANGYSCGESFGIPAGYIECTHATHRNAEDIYTVFIDFFHLKVRIDKFFYQFDRCGGWIIDWESCSLIRGRL